MAEISDPVPNAMAVSPNDSSDLPGVEGVEGTTKL
jgi:hypothetical protein